MSTNLSLSFHRDRRGREKICEKLRRSIENWPVGHMRRLSGCARREAGRRGVTKRQGGGGPHYKFNLTNGSENLETMEYMKCGRVYHDARHGVVPAAILSGPIHILRRTCQSMRTG